MVVGAGLLGLGASGALASLGRDVLCLDLAEVGHAWSGSKGNSRAFRYNYDEPMLNAMVAEAERAWRDLETASGLRILERTPFLNFGDDLTGYAGRLEAAGSAVEYLEADEVARRFPGLAIRGPAVLEPTAGMLRADRARDALRASLRAELRESVEVTAVRDGADTARVETTDGDIEADQAGSDDHEFPAFLFHHIYYSMRQISRSQEPGGRAWPEGEPGGHHEKPARGRGRP